jgi:hypothetical protein
MADGEDYTHHKEVNKHQQIWRGSKGEEGRQREIEVLVPLKGKDCL